MKKNSILLLLSIIILVLVSVFLFSPYIRENVLGSNGSGTKIYSKPNSHFNREKIQGIISNTTLSPKQKALMANNLGYQLYKKNRFGEAIEYFEFALNYDNTFLQAHHNLACALLKEDQACGKFKAFHEILIELRLDPSRKEYIANDSDLITLRLTNAYSVLQNGFPQNDSIFKVMLIGRWYKVNKLAFDPDIQFGSNTKGYFSRVTKDGKIQKTEFSYYVIDKIISMIFTDDSGKQTKKQLQIDYDLDRMIVLRDFEGYDTWSEFNDCDK